MDQKKIEEQLKDLKSNFQNRNVWTIFFGAGASKDANYLTMTELCDILIRKITEKNEKKSDYESLIFDIYNFRKIEDEDENVNLESILEDLYRLSWVMLNRSQIELSYPSIKKISKDIINEALLFVKREVVASFKKVEPKIETTRNFIEYWFTGSRYLKVFTTNWDPLIEHACDSLLNSNKLNIRCIDGFNGIYNKKLDFDLYNEKIISGIQEHVHRLDLIKLHGSLDWRLKNEIVRKTINNEELKDENQVMIFPTPAKEKESFGYPYAELFRMFSNTILDAQQCKYLLCIGVSFSDAHINSIISQALKRKREDFNLYTVDPSITQERLYSIFGDSKSIQQPINIKFEQFVAYLKEDKLS